MYSIDVYLFSVPEALSIIFDIHIMIKNLIYSSDFRAQFCSKLVPFIEYNYICILKMV
jgi:hypothetical protein